MRRMVLILHVVSKTYGVACGSEKTSHGPRPTKYYANLFSLSVSQRFHHIMLTSVVSLYNLLPLPNVFDEAAASFMVAIIFLLLSHS